MIISAAIVSREGKIFHSENLPENFKSDLNKHAKNFIYLLNIEKYDFDQPYIETRHIRFVFKQTEDLHWLLVTRTESDLYSDINLLGKFVSIIMEYGASETNSDTITEEQQDIFYRHIWRPWDEDSSYCSACDRHCVCSSLPDGWRQKFNTRVNFLSSIRDGDLDEKDVTYFNGLMAEAWAIQDRLTRKRFVVKDPDGSSSESDNGSTELEYISEVDVIEGCRFKCRLEDIRVVLKRLQDPYLRLFARRDLLTGSEFEGITLKQSTAPMDTSISADHSGE